MRTFAATLMAVWGLCALAACESSGGQYDGVSRFAGASTPYYGPGSMPREPAASPSPEQPDAPVDTPGSGSRTGNI